MSAHDDNIVIRRQGKKKQHSSKKTSKPEGAFNVPAKFTKHARVFGVLLFLFSALLLLALVSYTSKDQANASISFFDLFGIITGNEDIIARAETTRNWLGLTGAVMADWFINQTIGFFIILLPFFIGWFAKEIFFNLLVKEKTLKRFVVYLIIATFAASLIGALQQLSWMPLTGTEWSGSIGRFLAEILASLISSAGAILVFLALIIVTVILGTDINIDRFTTPADNYINQLKLKFLNFIDNIRNKSQKNKKEKVVDNDPKNSSTAPPPIKPQESAKSDDNVRIINTSDNKEKNIRKTPSGPRIINLKKDRTDSDISEDEGSALDILRPGKKQAAKPAINKTSRQEIVYAEPDPEIRTVRSNKEIDELEEEPIDENTIEDITHSETDQDIRDTERFKKVVNIKPRQITADDLKNNEIQTPTENVSDYNNDDNSLEILTESNSSENDFDISNDSQEISFRAGSDYSELTSEQVDEFDSIDEFSVSIDDLKNQNEISEEPKLQDQSVPKTNPKSGSNISSETNKPLVVTVHETKEEENDQLLKKHFLSTEIHDESISYRFPDNSLLKEQTSTGEVDDQELKDNARILQEKLETFKIYIENLGVTPGPVVTQYSFVPAAGIKISKIENLSDDLAMALKARGIRIIAPIPGKGTVGIEIPNQNPQIVRFSNVINSNKFHDNNYALPIALGKTISGETAVADLSKMPHLLIAGSTGSGKSVGINTIICSLLYKKHPSTLKFVIVDPKKVELQQYNGLVRHFLAVSPDINSTIITDPKEAVIGLKAVVAEMEKRYDLLASVGQRNIKDYNKKVKSGKLKNDPNFEHRPMPFIVVVIDELADLMLTASKDVEEPITRLAQMARAVGIHLIIATQRPSVDVITGIIKANFPARMAYLVASRIDSRTILDMQGAEQLLGNGDMLFLPNGTPKPIRVQNSFISTEEVDNICEYIEAQKGYTMPYQLPSLNEKDSDSGGFDDASSRDPLFEEAARLVIRHQQGSVSIIQRRLKVGYARAGRIVDELEAAGIVGPYDGSKARQVYMESEMELEAVL